MPCALSNRADGVRPYDNIPSNADRNAASPDGAMCLNLTSFTAPLPSVVIATLINTKGRSMLSFNCTSICPNGLLSEQPVVITQDWQTINARYPSQTGLPNWEPHNCDSDRFPR